MLRHEAFAFLVFMAVLGLTLLLSFAARQLLYRGQNRFARDSQMGLKSLFIFADPVLLWKLNLMLLAVLPVLTWWASGSVVVAAGAAFLILLLPRLIMRWLQKRRLDRLHAQLPDALMMLASGLRSGANLQQAMEGLSRDLSPPISQELGLVVREQRLGAAFEDAIDLLAERIPSPDVQLVASALRISREVGGSLADTVARLGETIRKRLMMEQKIKSLTAQGRLQGIVMTALPALIILALLQIEPQAMGALFSTTQGWAVLAVAILCEILGYFWIRKIVSIEV
ncbi:type II secretion system F family protein [Acidithiobacillus thiooxidans]|uniref:type II secretion system F family protein n=1 Tax=Acidithiobacillus thiooxidans TaxID=930 RepID=UPI00286534B4|nr:type II secretion system F family protein [Acidithiobacillus thiooxidans]MDR7928715.1 type II secretion system F family protein [Acidithiobacillus thiooxidans]